MCYDAAMVRTHAHSSQASTCAREVSQKEIEACISLAAYVKLYLVAAAAAATTVEGSLRRGGLRFMSKMKMTTSTKELSKVGKMLDSR